jgi:hypothetical protein
MGAPILNRVQAATPSKVQNFLAQQLDDLVLALPDLFRCKDRIPMIAEAKLCIQPQLPRLLSRRRDSIW